MSQIIPGGLLVAIEGIDGAGKTTQANLIESYCRDKGIPHILSKEPTGGKFGSLLRKSAESGRYSLEEELELFLQDRREHVEKRINPSLQQGRVVILDRYYFSTAAYQGARGADLEMILAENEKFAPAPDLLILLDVDVSTGLARIHDRGDKPNTFEREDMLQRSREIFRGIKRNYCYPVDARFPLEIVSGKVLAAFQTAAVNKISMAGLGPEAVNRTLQFFGGEPLPLPG